MIFSQTWFTRHQKILLWFANSFIGRYVLRIHGNRSSVGKNKIIKILPNSITWKGKKKREFVTEFRTHDKFGKRLFYAFKPFWYLCHLWDMAWYPNFNLGFDSLTAYPAAGANAPVDGWVNRSGVNQTLSDIRAGAGVAANTAEASQAINYLHASTTGSQYEAMYRSIYCYDTSSLTEAMKITAAVFSIYGSGSSTGMGNNDAYCVAATPANVNTLVAGDYGQLGSTSFAIVEAATWNTSGYNDFTLDANGIANIDIATANNTKYGIRGKFDFTGSATGLSWGSGGETYVSGYYADQTGATNDPKLVVTYTLPMGGYIFISS